MNNGVICNMCDICEILEVYFLFILFFFFFFPDSSPVLPSGCWWS